MEKNEAKPTESQIEWSNCEIGVIIHCDIEICQPEYQHMKNGKICKPPNLDVFNPNDLDTDQWISIAKKAGAKYAVLTAKHVTGFTLFPDENYEYSIDKTPFRKGKGDIVDDFIKSCHKFGIKPGIYYSCEANSYLGIHKGSGYLPPYPSKEWDNFKELVTRHLTHLWTEYGDLFEIWFDGGLLENGPDYIGLLKKYQPRSNAFQGPEGFPSRLRWVGNEDGLAPYPCWSTTNYTGSFDGTEANSTIGFGDPDGDQWIPAETDVPLRFKNWFWKPNQDFLVAPAEEIFKWYYNSVGRNSNLLIGMVIDENGLVPNTDAKELERFGEIVKNTFGKPLKSVNGKGDKYSIEFNSPTYINHCVLMENIRKGHVVRKFCINGVQEDKKEINLYSGASIGHKHILKIDKVKITKITLEIVESMGKPDVLEFSVYYFVIPEAE